MSKANIKQAIADLTEQVRANTSAEAAAAAMITNIADRMKEAENDAGALAELTQELRNSAGALGAAVVANTAPPNPAPAPADANQP
jgi:hypothetical protein